MKNVIIGVLVVLVIVGAVWYFGMGGRHYFGMGSEMHMNSQMDSMTDQEDMVQCPVMGTKIKKSNAYSSTEYMGKTYYFCCAACPGAFEKNPEKFAK